MKILYLSRSKNDYAQIRFKEEAEKKGLEIRAFNYAHLCFRLSLEGFDIFGEGREKLKDFDFLILRSPGLTRRYVWQEKVLVDWFLKRKKRVLNGKTLKFFPEDFDKLWQNYFFYLAKIPFVPTEWFGCPNLLKEKKEFPFIVKRLVGSLGRDLQLIKNESQVEKFLRFKHPYEFIVQEFLPTGEDYRLIVLGGEVLGIMKRKAKKGQVATNVAVGGKAEKASFKPELVELAKKACSLLKCEFAGVDIMYDLRGNPYVLEVNRYPVFKGFEKATGINVAKKVVEYLISERRNAGR